MTKRSAIDFFKEKRGWSEIKDNLLSWYLTPYLSKVLSTAKHFYLIDGFSGPGFFEDFKKGSPMIEKDLIVKSVASSKNKFLDFNLICVEANKELFKRLVENFKQDNWVKCIKGNIEEELPKIIENCKPNSFVFIYLDPFGINGLPNNLDTLFYKRKDLKIELLINFNSSGCYRECMRLLGDTSFDEYFELNSYISDPQKSIERMNLLLGTKDWNKYANSSKAEYLISLEFCKKLKRNFKYVLNMPVKDIKTDQIKYRMIHCSNNLGGTLLMADNMYKKINTTKPSLFSTDLEGNIIDPTTIVLGIMDLIPLSTKEKPIRLSHLILNFYEKHGIVCSTNQIIDFLKKMEKENRIVVLRHPDRKKGGTATTFWNEKNDHIILLSKKVDLL